VAASAVAVLSLVTGLALAAWQARVATIQRQRADRRFNEVRQLANALIFTLHDAVAPLPGSTPVRQQIVSEGLKYLERLTPDSVGDPALQFELGRAYIQIGRVQGLPNVPNLGDRAGAIASFTKAQALLAPIATRPDSSPAVFSSYLDALRFLSGTLATVGADRAASVAAARRASDDATRFAERHPDLEDALLFQAMAEFQLAQTTGHPGALPHWQKAVGMYEALLAKQPDDPRRQRNAALVRKYLGGFHDTEREYAAALIHHTRALELDQQRYDRARDDRTAKLDVAIDLSNVAYAHWRQNALPDAIAMYRRSLAMREDLLASDPRDAFVRSKVAFVHRQLGELLRTVGNGAEAMDHLRQAILQFERTGMSLWEEKAEAAAAWSQIAKLEVDRGRSPAACEALGQAFRLYGACSERERLTSEGSGEDPLIKVAQQASACRVAGAAEWLQNTGPRTRSQ
jgi:non-specific serine/threonine protein kinase/serine/threonine-protein kinase